MTDAPGLFEILHNTRAMKRLKPDPVPLELIRKVLDAGTQAPSGVNTQPWEFVVVRDVETKKWIQERYLHFSRERFGALVISLETTDTPHARMLRTVMHLAEHLHEAPVLLFVCGHRDWPAAVPVEKRVGKAPPPYGSIYPARRTSCWHVEPSGSEPPSPRSITCSRRSSQSTSAYPRRSLS